MIYVVPYDEIHESHKNLIADNKNESKGSKGSLGSIELGITTSKNLLEIPESNTNLLSPDMNNIDKGLRQNLIFAIQFSI